MDIYYQGHSCFRIRGKSATVVIDPFGPDLGYSLGKLEADVVAVTHQHKGHNYVQGVSGEFRTVASPGEYEVAGVFLTGLASFHDDKNGEVRGKNVIFLVEMDGFTVCHLGDLGHVLTSRSVADLGKVDVLMLPVGGVTTIDAVAAADVMRRLDPKLVVPMHYKTPSTTRDLQPVDRFLKEVGSKEGAPQQRLAVNPSSLSGAMQVVLLEYPGSRAQPAERA